MSEEQPSPGRTLVAGSLYRGMGKTLVTQRPASSKVHSVGYSHNIHRLLLVLREEEA